MCALAHTFVFLFFIFTDVVEDCCKDFVKTCSDHAIHVFFLWSIPSCFGIEKIADRNRNVYGPLNFWNFLDFSELEHICGTDVLRTR